MGGAAALPQLRAGLADGRVVDSLFDEAGDWRVELMKGRE